MRRLGPLSLMPRLNGFVRSARRAAVHNRRRGAAARARESAPAVAPVAPVEIVSSRIASSCSARHSSSRRIGVRQCGDRSTAPPSAARTMSSIAAAQSACRRPSTQSYGATCEAIPVRPTTTRALHPIYSLAFPSSPYEDISEFTCWAPRTRAARALHGPLGLIYDEVLFSQVSSEQCIHVLFFTFRVSRSSLTLTPVRHGATLPYRAISLPMAMLIPAAGHNVAHDSRLAA